MEAYSVSSCAKQIVEPCHLASALPINAYRVTMVQNLKLIGCFFLVVHIEDS